MKINKELMYTKLVQLCWITIIACTLLKFCGNKQFEIPDLNIVPPLYVRIIINCSLFTINGIIFSLILLKRKLKFKELIIIVILNVVDYIVTFNMPSPYYIIVDLACYIIIAKLFSKFPIKVIIHDCIFILVMFAVYQGVTKLYKDINKDIRDLSFTFDLVLQIDYYCLLILTTLREFKKGGNFYERWKTILAILSKRKRIEKSLQQNKKNVQEIEFGYKLFIALLSIAQFFTVGVACYFVNGVMFEYIIVFISFVIMRGVFGNSYHAQTITKCTTLALLIFITATRLSLPLWVSSLCNVIIGCLVAYMMYVMYYYIKFTNITGITIYKGMCLDDLNSLCDLYHVYGIDRTILKEYYVNRKRLDYIAMKVNYSVDNVKKRKANILNKFKETIS